MKASLFLIYVYARKMSFLTNTFRDDKEKKTIKKKKPIRFKIGHKTLLLAEMLCTVFYIMT